MPKLNKTQMLEGTPYQHEDAKFVANNTLQIKLPGLRIIRHFHTNVLMFDSYTDDEGTIIVFNTDGHRSNTTRGRLNDFQDFVDIWTDKRVWYAKIRGDEEVVVYKDGMTYHPKRGLENCGKVPDKKLVASIRKYAKDFAAALPIEQPGAGDCMICCLGEQGVDAAGVSHLLSHIEENYFVPRLLWNAMVEADRTDLVRTYAFKDQGGNSYPHIDSFRDWYERDVFNFMYSRIIDGRTSRPLVTSARGYAVR